ncbi:MAG: hypothetical protein KZQ96_23275 [Candidatus Thiodiazotropha sp. (ex Lucinoma borealis)]|nr:hypothetical protein [Candidatus Thiodiazotropha sp. (ex Lucinoma borealis)]
MRTTFQVLAAVITLAGCTHASISSIPLQIEGVGTVYRYQGRANFAHQIAKADRMIAEDCKARNGGHPVIVDLKKRDLGIVTMDSGQATTRINATATGNSHSTNVTGTATTTSSGGVTALRNYNQEILYKCVTD